MGRSPFLGDHGAVPSGFQIHRKRYRFNPGFSNPGTVGPYNNPNAFHKPGGKRQKPISQEAGKSDQILDGRGPSPWHEKGSKIGPKMFMMCLIFWQVICLIILTIWKKKNPPFPNKKLGKTVKPFRPS